VKSCRAYVFLLASSIFSINKNRRFCHDIYFYVVYFILLLFPEKMVIQKTQKEYYSLFLLKINPKSLHLLILLKITHKSCAD